VYRYLKLVGLIDKILVELDCEQTICTGKLFSLKSTVVKEIGESKELYILDSKYSCNVYVEVGNNKKYYFPTSIYKNKLKVI
jgi:hypothetical protein